MISTDRQALFRWVQCTDTEAIQFKEVFERPLNNLLFDTTVHLTPHTPSIHITIAMNNLVINYMLLSVSITTSSLFGW